VPTSGAIRFYNSSAAPINFIVDLQGYDTGTSTTILPTPARLAFSQTGQGYYNMPIQSWISYQYDTTAVGVPSSARAAIVELSTTPSYAGYLSAFADQAGVPFTSNLNFSPGIYQSNLAIVPITNGIFDIYKVTPADTNDVAIDVIGYIN
jgi:hypothetical protein